LRLLQHTATYCNTLHYTATHCNTLQHTATHCNTLHHTATHCNTLQHTKARYDTLQHTASHCNTLRYNSKTGWPRCIECLTLQISVRKRATNYRAFLRKMTCKDKASYASSPSCTRCRMSKTHSLSHELIHHHTNLFSRLNTTNPQSRLNTWHELTESSQTC